jgi:hypothetical protein
MSVPPPFLAMTLPLSIVVFLMVAAWRVFEKAGRPGWAVLIPFYNLYTLIKIAERPGWWLLFFLVPVVNLIVGMVISVDIARRFGKEDIFGVGLLFLGFIFYPVLAFSDASYRPHHQPVRTETQINDDGTVVEVREVGPDGEW